jgi:L-arabinose isomerase
MIDLKSLEVWFVPGSQDLYGREVLAKVDEHAREIARGLGASPSLPLSLVVKPVVTSPSAILELCRQANAAPACAGLVFWMHTFSPAKMWIPGLSALQKPFVHLHTQYHRAIPWGDIDMDFMNLNQSAHGDREFGFITSRMRLRRTVVVGHWADRDVQEDLGRWARAAAAWHDGRRLKVARFGDNMRDVAVTEGDKVEAEIVLGYSVNGFDVGDLVERVDAVGDAAAERLAAEYEERYAVAAGLERGGARRDALRTAARIELGLRAFLDEGGFGAFTTSFQALHGLAQLPGLAVQRLMADGYGFGAEGDWKTAALVRAVKVMSAGLPGGTSFMEDYTYHLDTSYGGMKVLGAHMLEVCESIADRRPSLEIHPLSIGGKADPVRLVFDAAPGPAVNATIVDMGNRFRMVANAVEVVRPAAPLPKLPVARALWIPRPDLKAAAAAWILAGGAHHSAFSTAIGIPHLRDFAEIAGVEFLAIDEDTRITAFRNELRWNEAAWKLSPSCPSVS